MEHKNPSMKNILRTKLETLLENSKKLKDEKYEKRINTNGVSFSGVFGRIRTIGKIYLGILWKRKYDSCSMA
ncbi:MAG: hypothetical protein ACLUUO_05730 [Sellimonas intestinalis]